MIVLVAYATRHGSTAGIAERIAAGLRAAGLTATVSHVGDVRDVEPYAAVVLGGATYMTHWLKEATAFARSHRVELQQRPVWLFSSGPLGADQVDEDGHDIVETTRPREFDELSALLHPRGEMVFFGAYDPDAPAIGLAERLLRLLPAGRKALPAGDFRNWPDVDAWAADIARTLGAGGRLAADG